MKIYFEKKKIKSMQACIHFPSKANPSAVYLKEICNCVVSARKEFHTIEMQFSNWKEKNPTIILAFFPDNEKNKIPVSAKSKLGQYSNSLVVNQHGFTWCFYIKNTIEKAFFLHHIHHSASVCACYPKGRVHPGLHQKQGGQQVREMILLW